MSTPIQLNLEIITIIEEYLKKNSGASSILDLGTGLGQNGFLVRHYAWSEQVNLSIIGLEIWKPYALALKSSQIYNDIVIADASNPPFVENVFDVIIASEIIEHMKKPIGLHFLDQIEKIAKTKSLLVTSTPQDELEQGTVHGNAFQEHVSVWTAEEFKKMGYSVIFSPLIIRVPKLGAVFLPVRNYKQTILINKITNTLFFFLGTLANLLPQLCGEMIAFKVINKT